MRKCLPALLAVLFLAPAVPARALDFPTEPRPGQVVGGTFDPHGGLDVGLAAGPVFAPDALLVATQSGLVITMWRLSLGRFPERLAAFAVPAHPAGDGPRFEFVRAGDGVFLLQGVRRYEAIIGGAYYVDNPAVTWFAEVGGRGVDVPICAPERCGSCPEPALTILPDDTQVGIVPQCRVPGRQTVVSPVVRDLETGEDTPLPTNGALHLAGRYVDSAGSDGSLTVSDWRTGEVLSHTGPVFPSAHVLLHDGTLLYADSSGSVRRWAPGATGWEPTPMTGEPVAVAGGRLLTREPLQPYGRALLRVWSLDGSLLGSLDTEATPGDFDGRRVALRITSCLTTRFTVWEVGGSRPEPDLPAACGVPRVVPPARVGPSAVRVRLRCPATTPQGCAGAVAVSAPPSDDEPRPAPVPNFALRPGQERVVTVAWNLSGRGCRRLARPARLPVWITTSQGRSNHAPLVAQRRAGRIARCR
ncbi:MAG: hypothetical protein ACJ762_15020 [Solirubrobacteraceae bacterium]